MIKAVLFDLDGTLLNRDESVTRFIDNQYERLIEIVGHIPKETYCRRFIELDNRGYVWKDKVYEQLVREFGVTRLNSGDLLQDYINEFSNHCVPFPNLHNMLQKLKDYDLMLGMITNGYGQFQLDNIKALNIEHYFNTILISEWENIKKPNPKIFEKALKELNVKPHQSVFIGDHPENDVKASKNVGMIGIWKKDVQWEKVDADFIIDDLNEVHTLIQEINKEKARL